MKTTESLEDHYRHILQLLGEDAEREGLIKTPHRVAKAMQFLTKGYFEDPAEILNSARFTEEYQQMVLVKDIEMYSLCEHHMLPFYGKAHVAYIPNGYITGVSKIVRVVETYARRQRIRYRIRKRISGTTERPRMAVYRSNKQIYVQLIDDTKGVTLTQASSKDASLAEEVKGKTPVQVAALVGKLAAERALEKGISTVSFDRGGYLFHGRVKSLADAAREGGLKF
jgi:GTP cyclohydrolase I